jgi:hypothetical protein
MTLWPFEDVPATAVVTTTHVTTGGLPILYVCHDLDEDGEPTWQFHCGTIDFDMKDAQLVRLDTIFRIDPSIAEVADLPFGHCATRSSIGGAWHRNKESWESSQE